MAIEDSVYLTSGKVGGMLASAAQAPVYWSTGQAKWPAGTEVYPKTLPPLRGDRDTVLVGTSQATGAQKLALGVEGPGGPQTLDWDLPAVHSNSANGYLRPMVEQGRIDGGVTLPLVDTVSFQQAREDLLVGGRNFDQLARTALAANNVEGAEKLVTEALRRDPHDPEATALREALAKRRAAAGAAAVAPPAPAANLPPVGAANDLNLVGSGAPAGVPLGHPLGPAKGPWSRAKASRGPPPSKRRKWRSAPSSTRPAPPWGSIPTRPWPTSATKRRRSGSCPNCGRSCGPVARANAGRRPCRQSPQDGTRKPHAADPGSRGGRQGADARSRLHAAGPAEGQAVDGPLRGAHARRQVPGGRRGCGGRGGQDHRQPHGPDQ